MEQGARESLQHRARDQGRSGRPDTDCTGARQEHRADQAARRYAVGEARAYPESVAHRVLGSPDASRRARAAAEGLGGASEGALSADDQSRPFPRGPRRLSTRASGSEARAGLQRALPSLRLQPVAAGARAPVLQGLDRRRISARARDRDSTRESVLRRFVRGELRERRPVCGCNSAGTDSLPRKEISRARQRAGRDSSTAARRADGKRWQCR